MRYGDLTTEQTKALLDAIRDLPEGWRDLDDGELLARLTAGETGPAPDPDPNPEGETDPDPEPEAETDPDPEPTLDPIVFEIPAPANSTGLYEHLIFGGAGGQVSLHYTPPGPNSGDIYYFRDFYNGGNRRLNPEDRYFDNAKSGLEAALADGLTSVAKAEVTIGADKWRIEITPATARDGLVLSGQTGADSVSRYRLSLDSRYLNDYDPDNLGLYSGRQRFLETIDPETTPAPQPLSVPDPEPTPGPAEQTLPEPGALVFKFGYGNYSWVELSSYQTGQEAPAGTTGRILTGEFVKTAESGAVYKHYDNEASRIETALEGLPNVATARVTITELDYQHPVTGLNKEWRIELTEGSGGIEKLQYSAGEITSAGNAGDILYEGELTPLERTAETVPDLVEQTPTPDGGEQLERRPTETWLEHQLRLANAEIDAGDLDGLTLPSEESTWGLYWNPGDSGRYQLRFDDETTGELTPSSTAAQIDAALEAMDGIESAEVDGEPGAWTLTLTAESGHPLAAIDTAFDGNLQLNYLGA